MTLSLPEIITPFSVELLNLLLPNLHTHLRSPGQLAHCFSSGGPWTTNGPRHDYSWSNFTLHITEWMTRDHMKYLHGPPVVHEGTVVLEIIQPPLENSVFVSEKKDTIPDTIPKHYSYSVFCKAIISRLDYRPMSL